MAAMSDYLENKLIDFIFRQGSFTAPTTLGIALCGTSPSDASISLTGVEMGTAGAYARATVNPSTSNWLSTNGNTDASSSGTGGTTTNASAIIFPTATANWQNYGSVEAAVTHAAISNSTSYAAGTMLFYGQLTNSKTVNTGDIFQFSANNFSISID